MKKNTIYFPSKIILLLLVLTFFAGCKKTDDNTNGNNQNSGNTGNTGNTGNSVAYKFSSPQNITSIPVVFYAQRSFVATYHVYTRIISTVNSMFFNKNGTIASFGFEFPNEIYTTSNRAIYAGTGPFCVDEKEQYLYVVVSQHLYKCNLSTLKVVNLTPLTLGLGTCSFIKVMNNGDVVFSTDLNNGSIQRIANGSSTPATIISNLGATPSAIDIIDNDIYFTLDVNNGSVQKITSSGIISTVIDNLTHPSRFVFDNNGNFILESQITLDGNNYGQYSIYTKSGSKVTDITDNNNLLILSTPATETMIPLYVDSNNNLFFGHYDYGGSSAINHCNPFIDGKSLNIYKLQLIKQ